MSEREDSRSRQARQFLKRTIFGTKIADRETGVWYIKKRKDGATCIPRNRMFRVAGCDQYHTVSQGVRELGEGESTVFNVKPRGRVEVTFSNKKLIGRYIS